MSYISSGSVCLHLMTSVLLLNTDKKKKKREREDSSKEQQCDLWPRPRDSGEARCTDERCSTRDCGDLQNQSAAVKFSKGARWWGGAALRRFLEATDGLK